MRITGAELVPTEPDLQSSAGDRGHAKPVARMTCVAEPPRLAFTSSRPWNSTRFSGQSKPSTSCTCAAAASTGAGGQPLLKGGVAERERGQQRGRRQLDRLD
jgi:hypothetical protein